MHARLISLQVLQGRLQIRTPRPAAFNPLPAAESGNAGATTPAVEQAVADAPPSSGGIQQEEEGADVVGEKEMAALFQSIDVDGSGRARVPTAQKSCRSDQAPQTVEGPIL
jgi:hypothetical protein